MSTRKFYCKDCEMTMDANGFMLHSSDHRIVLVDVEELGAFGGSWVF